MKKAAQYILIFLIVCWFSLMIAGFLNSLNQPVTTQDVRQYIDHDARVVCYILENGNGISCLPLSEVSINE